MGFEGLRWVSMGFDGFWWVSTGFDGFRRASMGFDGLRWVLMGFDEFWWVGGIYRLVPFNFSSSFSFMSGLQHQSSQSNFFRIFQLAMFVQTKSLLFLAIFFFKKSDEICSPDVPFSATNFDLVFFFEHLFCALDVFFGTIDQSIQKVFFIIWLFSFDFFWPFFLFVCEFFKFFVFCELFSFVLSVFSVF